MDRDIALHEIVQREIEDYAGPLYAGTTHAISDPLHQIYAVNVIPDNGGTFIAVQARVVGEYVVIDVDNTDRPLYKELLRVGIPRERIVLGYAGETLPAVPPSA